MASESRSFKSIVALVLLFSLTSALQCDVQTTKRIDCFPEVAPLTRSECEGRGCCYSPTDKNDDIPWCFFPPDYAYSYILTELKDVDYGLEGLLKIEDGHATYPVQALPTLKLSIYLETPDRLHFKIQDESDSRYQVPIDVPEVTSKTVEPTKYVLNVSPINDTFHLRVSRKDSNTILFDTSVGPILFGDQFLQISTSLSSQNIFGLGERHDSLRPDMNWNRIPFWAADRAPNVPEKDNLYGDHPFYLVMEPDGRSHGVFFLNSNAKEAVLQSQPALTWRSIGGIMDFYVFLGPSPEEVIQQYTDVVGHTFMPPMWSLGYHLCRWGYKTSNHTLDYVEKMRNAKIPQDVQWNDIDYMDSKMDFTYDKKNFDTLPEVVENLHANGQHYVMIIDPGISDRPAKGTYPPYDDAIEMGVVIKDYSTLQPVRGKVWPGQVIFPDFSDPNAPAYWMKQLARYHSDVPFDGVWIDMNELSNFMNGSPENCYTNNTYDYPPYVPRISGGTLFSKTVCPSSLQHVSRNYDIHSLTGLMEMNATSYALKVIRKKRPFVISRSTFPSAGRYGGHWTGDVASSWSHLKVSVSGILSFNMFGIPMVGADICGFRGSTTEELCVRWSQLGAFYPFSRNHNDINGLPQAPVDFSENVQNIIKNALEFRYALLPYLYTLFHYSHVNGSTVARPLFFEFPFDKNTYEIDKQFMWGSSLMISPVLDKGATFVSAYVPAGLWYDFYLNKGSWIQSEGEQVKLSAPLEHIPVHIRGGHVIPGSVSGTVTNMSNHFFIIAAADEQGTANGSLFWDDGDSLETYHNGHFVIIQTTMKSNSINIQYLDGDKQLASTMVIDNAYILGVKCHPIEVKANGKDVPYHTDANNLITVELHAMPMVNIHIGWTC